MFSCELKTNYLLWSLGSGDTNILFFRLVGTVETALRKNYSKCLLTVHVFVANQTALIHMVSKVAAISLNVITNPRESDVTTIIPICGSFTISNVDGVDLNGYVTCCNLTAASPLIVEVEQYIS